MDASTANYYDTARSMTTIPPIATVVPPPPPHVDVQKM